MKIRILNRKQTLKDLEALLPLFPEGSSNAVSVQNVIEAIEDHQRDFEIAAVAEIEGLENALVFEEFES